MNDTGRLSRRGAIAAVLLTGSGLGVLGSRTAYFARTGADPATRVEFTVETHNYRHTLDDAAASLWYACVGVINWETASGPRRVGDRFVAAVTPSLGDDSTRRFKGCLQDGTIDKVRGHVVRIEGVEDVDPRFP